MGRVSIFGKASIALLLFLKAFNLVAFANEEKDKHPKLLSPVEERSYFVHFFSQYNSGKKSFKNMFPFMFWDECHDDDLKGTYVGYPCSQRRMISNILYRFLDEHFYKCVDEGARELGLSVYDYSIIHAGIFADKRHSTRSLHSEGRAIDIKSIELYLTNGRKVSQKYLESGGNPFYKNLRKCWGEVLYRHNTCPYVDGKVLHTGSIGKENANHQKHLHLSVPYCINYAYSDLFFRR